MKNVLALLVLFLLLGGGAVGGMTVMGIPPFDGLLPKPDSPDPEAVASSMPEEDFRLVELGTIGVPIIDGRSVRRQVFITVAMKVPTEANNAVVNMKPKLMDAFLKDLIIFLPEHLEDNKIPEHDMLHARLSGVAERVLGPGKVTEILIQAIFQR